MTEPRLTALLSDYTAPAEGRVGLLNKVIDSVRRANSTARLCCGRPSDFCAGERADEAVIDLAELAVARRGEIVAHVTAAADLTDAQRTRLTEVLSPHLRPSGVGAAARRSRPARRTLDRRR